MLELEGTQPPHLVDKEVLNISWLFVIESGLEAPCPFNYCLPSFSFVSLLPLFDITDGLKLLMTFR